MKIILFGEDIFSSTALQSLVEYHHDILAVVCPFRENDNNYKSLKRISDDNNILFIHQKDINSEYIREYLTKVRPDLLISVHLRKIIKKEIFSIPKYGAINVHPSLLPKYKGLSPQQQALIHGDNETAVTIHFIEEGIDTGDIITQERVSITPSDYISDLQFKILNIYKHIFIKAIKLIETPTFVPIKQSNFGESYFGKIKEKDRQIDLGMNAKEVFNKVRAFSMPYAGAFHNEVVFWSVEYPNRKKERELLSKYPLGVHYKSDEDYVIIRLKNEILFSYDFEFKN